MPILRLENVPELLELLILRLESVLEMLELHILRLESVLERCDVLVLLVVLGLRIAEELVRQRCIIQKHTQTHLEQKV